MARARLLFKSMPTTGISGSFLGATEGRVTQAMSASSHGAGGLHVGRIQIVEAIHQVLQAVLLAVDYQSFLFALDRVDKEHQAQAKRKSNQRAIEGDGEVSGCLGQEGL